MESEKSAETAYQFDRFVLDLTRGALLTAHGAELPLRPKSFSLLQLLVQNAGRLLDRDTIMNALWPDLLVTDDSITQCVHDIRRAFGNEAQNLLRTVPRRGYLFAAPVSRIGLPEQVIEPSPPDEVATTPVLAATSLADPPQPDQTGPSLSRHGAERRHLTVLFCDLVDSAALADQLEPEDLDAVMRSYRERCAAEIADCGGHIANYAGDGVLAFFGYPSASEDAAERSVRAGLAIVEALEALESRPGLQARVGIATGLVINDDAIFPGQAAVGKPLNLAARLQANADPGAVVIAESTRRLVGSLFALRDLGPQLFKGFATPVRVWRVTGDGVAESRFEALRGASLSPLVGREQELELMLDRWERAKEGEGQVVLLAGEPGVGKSRMIQALRDKLIGDRHIYLGYYCSPNRQDAPLRPVIAQLERAANFNHSDDPAQKLAKLETLLAEGGGASQVAPLIASLLSSANEAPRSALDVSPQQQRERTFEALLAQMAGLAKRRPVLLVWEDVHWADPTSLELLGRAIDRLQTLSVLAIVTFRPEFALLWSGRPHATGLTLTRLSRRRCGQLIAGLTGGKSLPTVVSDQIADKAEGIPLFIEELTKTVLDLGLLEEENGRYELKGSLPPLAIPATLHDSLMARLDRHAPVKEIAQIGAVIGREFSHELLTAVIPREEGLAERLRQLMAGELVFQRGAGARPSYFFKHSLVRDVAYASLLKTKRRQLHARIAQVLEERFAEVVDDEPDVLAHHWTEAGEAEKAAAYRLKAGTRALAHSATTEAVAQLTMGQELLQRLSENDQSRRSELDLQIALGAALSAAKGLAAPETARAYARARELCAQLGEKRQLVSVLLGLWSSHNARDELTRARAAAAQLLQLAEERQDETARILGHRALGATLFGLGEFAGARAHLQQLLTLDYQAARRSSVPLPYDPCVSGRAWLSLTLSPLGYPEQARAQSERALSEAQNLGHHTTTCVALCMRCAVGEFFRDHHDVARHAEALVAVAIEQGFAYWASLGAYFRGWALAAAGEMTAGIEEMRRALGACQATGAQAYVPYHLGLLANACRRANDVLEARKLLDEALARLGKTDSRYSEAELLRIDGELRLATASSDGSGAEASFRRAIEIARRQRAKAVEMRAAMSLARLWTNEGKRRQARDLLVPIYGWFTEGFDTELLEQARLLIGGLG